jgi:hypothetical protein
LQSSADERRLQAEWLAESGLARARARLTADPDYKGETWKIPASQLDGAHEGLVVVEVETRADLKRGERVVRVVADFPNADPAHRDRSSKQTIHAVSTDRSEEPK